MNNESVEILLATYNGETYLREQIQSILDQTYQNFRILVRDDLSTDSTAAILQEFAQKYPDRIFILPSKKNQGPIGNFSYLLEKAKSPYIMFSDQDDIWLADKIEKTLGIMKEKELRYGVNHPILVHSDLKVANAELEVIDPSYWNFAKINPEKQNTLNRMITQNIVTGCTMMINRSLSAIASPIPHQVMMHDWWLALVAVAFGTIEHIDTPTMLYRQHKKNVLGAQKFGSLPYLMKKIRELHANDDGKLRQASLFLQRYEPSLTKYQRDSLKSYLDLKNKSWIENKFLTLRFRFFKSGLLRNLIAFILKDLP